MRDLKGFFEPERIAVIGVSRDPNKVGHVVFRNLVDSGFEGEVIPINPKTEQILHYKVYKSIRDVKKKVDLAIIAVPEKVVLQVVRECNYSGIKNVLILTSGFSEIGNKRDEEVLRELLRKEKMNCIGVNCLGIFDARNKLDALFIPRYRLKRPESGGIGFVCQSGAIGAAILDIATEKGHKFSKFISYGNATDIDESDLLEYLGEDENTKVICLYLEGIKDGEKFFNIAREVSKKKPIVAIKGGLTKEGGEAALSHTGSLAGAKEVYFGVFRQTGIIRADNLEEMFDIASLVEAGIDFSGSKVQIITNGGGYGIISTDLIAESENLKLASLSDNTSAKLRSAFPSTINIHNPLDLVGDATTERYKVALENCIIDSGIDSILLIVLYQTPLITPDIVQVIAQEHGKTKKPIVVVSTGGEFTEALSSSLEEHGLPVFAFPKNAVSAMDKLVWYDKKRKVL